MGTPIKNLNYLAAALKPKILSLLDASAENAKQKIYDHLRQYYDEYDPSSRATHTDFYYRRTRQLRNCCKIGEPQVDSGKISIHVYLDTGALNYATEGADPYKTAVAANSGLHGGWDVSHLSDGQVPWSAISGNTGDMFGTGTRIWEEPMRELIEKGKLVAIFKKCARQRGLNIK